MKDLKPLRFQPGPAERLRESGQRVVVTGGSGWLGMATLEMLHSLFGAEFPDKVHCYGSFARELRLRGGICVRQLPLQALAELPPAPTLVLHLAFLGRDKTDMPPERYREVNRAISRQVFETLEKLDAHSIFIPSTWAVSLAGQTEAQKIYGELKLEDEERFSRWAEATGCRAVIARVFNLSGPYINKQDVYALASFIKDALRDLPISIQANKPVFRSFVAIEELMSVVVGQLLLSRNGTVRFDAVGEETIELGDLAVQVQQALKRPPDVRRPPMLERQRATERVGDPEPYRKLRAETGVLPIGMKEQILSTASFIAEELGLEA